MCDHDQDRHLLNAKLGELLYHALVTIRNHTYPPLPGEPDRRDEVNDLADLLHNMPRFIVGHDEYAMTSFEQFRGAVVGHVRRFYPSTDPAAHQYVSILDMDAETFFARHRDHNWDAPATPAAAR